MREAARERGHGSCRFLARPPLPEDEGRKENARDDKGGNDEAGTPGIAHGSALLQRRHQEDDSAQEEKRADDVGFPEEGGRRGHNATSSRFLRHRINVAREAVGQSKGEKDEGYGANRETVEGG